MAKTAHEELEEARAAMAALEEKLKSLVANAEAEMAEAQRVALPLIGIIVLKNIGEGWNRIDPEALAALIGTHKGTLIRKDPLLPSDALKHIRDVSKGKRKKSTVVSTAVSSQPEAVTAPQDAATYTPQPGTGDGIS